MATWRAGERLGLEGPGVLRPGAPADFLVLREDPTRDLGALATLESVVVAGRRHAVEDLRREHEAWVDRFSCLFARPLAKLGARAFTAWLRSRPAPEAPHYAAPGAV